MTLNEKVVNYKVVDLVEYYNFDIKFVFIKQQIRKLSSFSCSLSLPGHVFNQQ
jgi:hypothetical protein